MERCRAVVLCSTFVAAALLVMSSAAWACTIFASSITASPSSGQGSATVTVRGEGVGGSPTVELRWDGAADRVLATAPVDSAGHFAAVVTVPDAPPGIHTITALARGAGLGRTVFDVVRTPGAGTQAPEPSPASSLWSPTQQPQAATSTGRTSAAAGAALLGVGLIGLAAAFTVAGPRRRRAFAER